jgi:hypothetical protein
MIVLLALIPAGDLSVLSAEPAHSSAFTQAAGAAGPQSPATGQSANPSQAAPATQPSARAGQQPPVWRGAQTNHFSSRAQIYYEGVWGVDELRVKTAESGKLVRFNYRIVDPVKAAALNDKKAQPELFDAQARVKLVIPQLPNVGALRQSSTPKAGMTYWMAFSNPTRAVKPGHRVDVVIGSFRANNLLVE